MVRTTIVLALLAAAGALQGEELGIPFAPEPPAQHLPAPGGPHAVGVRAFAWVDAARPELATEDPGDHRETTVQLWYPATAGDDARVALYMPSLPAMLEAAEDLPAQAQRYVGLHAVLADVATHSRPGAPVLATRAPLPLILFSPGGNVSMHAQTALAERLASRGFVFAALSHAHSSLDVAPQTGFSMSMDWGLDQDDPVAARAADDRLAETLAGDVALVRARLAELREAGDPLAVALDLDAPVLAGHSRGGTTVGRVCAEVPEVDACIVLDNIGPDREQETGVAPPFLTLRSSWEPERVEQLHGYLGRTGSVAFDVEFEGSTHFSCTDLPLFIGDVRSPTVGAVAGIDACAAVIESFLRASIAEGAGWLPAIGGQTLSATRFDAAPSLRSP